MDSEERFHELKRAVAQGTERSKQNVEDLHAIEKALRENLERLKELRKVQSGSDNPKQK